MSSRKAPNRWPCQKAWTIWYCPFFLREYEIVLALRISCWVFFFFFFLILQMNVLRNCCKSNSYFFFFYVNSIDKFKPRNCSLECQTKLEASISQKKKLSLLIIDANHVMKNKKIYIYIYIFTVFLFLFELGFI